MHFGLGLFYGGQSVTAGWDSITYRKDSTGSFVLNSKSDKFISDNSNSYSALRMGFVPDVGLLFNPQGIFSVGLEWSEPLYYEMFSYRGPKKDGIDDFGTDINFSLNLIWNFDLKKKEE